MDKTAATANVLSSSTRKRVEGMSWLLLDCDPAWVFGFTDHVHRASTAPLQPASLRPRAPDRVGGTKNKKKP
ncbi:hypothetical protein OPV22_034997 [Ensete ventricosum]|uniref:Uncharacterized protein n=1 Tax=Ensete ventricosum TaxID=4639 RepID=A0AAV8PSA0_ENSVE|nr:hypothetical protein OPV22_034997 [Ensete ventricosum]